MRIELELQKQKLTQELAASKSVQKPLEADLYNHGIGKDEPLDIRNVIMDCYSNPNRKKHPNFFKDRGQSTSYSFCNKSQSAMFLLNRLKPGTIDMFNSKKIRLHNTSQFYDITHNSEPVDKIEYLKTLKNAKWYGPYIDGIFDMVQMVTIIESGENEYYVQLCISFVPQNIQKVIIHFNKNCSEISPFQFHQYFIPQNAPSKNGKRKS